jgi:hypothetical protein
VTAYLDRVVAAYDGGDGNLHLQIRDLLTNAFIANQSYSGSGIGIRNGYIGIDIFPGQPSYVSTADSIAKVDLATGSLLAVVPIAPYTPIADAGANYIESGGLANPSVMAFPTSGSAVHDIAQWIDDTDGVRRTSPAAPGPITAGGGNDNTTGWVAIGQILYYWDYATSNTWVTGPTLFIVSGTIRRVQAGFNGTLSIPYGMGKSLFDGGLTDVVQGGVGLLASFTTPALTEAGAMTSDAGISTAGPGYRVYVSGSDGGDPMLYYFDNVALTQGVIATLPATYGIPDSLCCSADGTIVYCLCSAAGVGYPVTVATGAIGTIASWGVTAPLGAQTWTIPTTGAPWVLAHVQVAPAASPWLVGLTP